jgi:hypothetical protein
MPPERSSSESGPRDSNGIRKKMRKGTHSCFECKYFVRFLDTLPCIKQLLIGLRLWLPIPIVIYIFFFLSQQEVEVGTIV